MARRPKGAKEPGSQKKLSPRVWAEIASLWELGEVTLADLHERYGVSVTHLSQKLSAMGAQKGAKAAEVAIKVREKIEEKALDDADETAKRIRETKDEHYNYSRTLARLTFQRIAEAVKEGRPLAELKDDILTIKNAMSALNQARQDRWVILGLDKDLLADEEMPKLIVEEMTPTEIEEAQRAASTELDVDVSLEEVEKLAKQIGGVND